MGRRSACVHRLGTEPRALGARPSIPNTKAGSPADTGRRDGYDSTPSPLPLPLACAFTVGFAVGFVAGFAALAFWFWLRCGQPGGVGLVVRGRRSLPSPHRTALASHGACCHLPSGMSYSGKEKGSLSCDLVGPGPGLMDERVGVGVSVDVDDGLPLNERGGVRVDIGGNEGDQADDSRAGNRVHGVKLERGQ